MKISELASCAGINSSAIRYYERAGLLPPPHRQRGQRRYAADALHRVRLICFAGDMGFTLHEIRVFFAGLRQNAPVGPRWKKLAHRKIREVEDNISRARKLKGLLLHLLECRCASLEICVERLRLSPDRRGLERPPSTRPHLRNS